MRNEDYNEINISLVFPLNAQFKDPKLLKTDSKFICFQDKSLFMLNKVKQKIVKEHKNTGPHNSVRGSMSKKGKKEADDMQLVIEEEETTKHHDSPTKQADEEQEEDEDDYEEVYRIYEYDLIDFSKVKYTNLKNYGGDDDLDLFDQLESENFGKYKDGFFYKRVKYDSENKYFNFEIFLKNELYNMEP